MQVLALENGLSQSDGLKLSHFRIIRISIKMDISSLFLGRFERGFRYIHKI